MKLKYVAVISVQSVTACKSMWEKRDCENLATTTKRRISRRFIMCTIKTDPHEPL